VDFDVLECGPGACLDPGPAGHPQLGRLRATARSYLSDTDPDRVDDALLVLGELIANALLHARPPILLRLQRHDHGRRLRVEVSDSSPCPPRPERRVPDESGGRGLHLVNVLSTAWGVIAGAGGKTVWAELLLSVSVPPPAPRLSRDALAPRSRRRIRIGSGAVLRPAGMGRLSPDRVNRREAPGPA
jgi:hypothetical protein